MSTEIDIRGATILIVDDNPNNLHMLEKMLQKFGCETFIALDGEMALTSVAAQKPDLVLLDVQMPKMDGYTVCEHLKSSQNTRDLPIIFVSAMTDELNRLKAFSSGAVDYITKPVEYEELKARISVHLRLAKQQKFLHEQAEELKVMNDVMIGREMRVLELKHEVNMLCQELNRKLPYKEAED